jgi:hypothetical protein
MEEIYEVYVKTDAGGYITAVNSSAFLGDTQGWVKIDQGFADRYRLAQGNYFPGGIVTEGGAWRYKLVEGAATETPQEEIAAMEEANSRRPEPGQSGDYATWEELEAALKEGVNAV